MSQPLKAVDALERELMRGRVRFIADISESFRRHRVGERIYELYARGQTRPRSGFLLSRFFAWTVMPNYKVAVFGQPIDDEKFTRTELIGMVDDIRKHVSDQGLKWAWAVLFSKGSLASPVLRLAERFDLPEVGIGIVDVSTGSVVHSRNLLGESLVRHFRLNKFIQRLGLRKTR